MKITKQELIKLNACKEGLDRFIDQTNNTDEPVDVISLIGGKNHSSDLLWLAGEKLPKEKIVRFACDCALINIELIKPYTDKYDEIVAFLNNPTDRAAAAARAAYAAYAARAAAAAARAAYAARAAAAAACAACDADAVTSTTPCVDATRATNAAVISGATEEQINKLLEELFS